MSSGEHVDDNIATSPYIDSENDEIRNTILMGHSIYTLLCMQFASAFVKVSHRRCLKCKEKKQHPQY